MIPVYLIYGEDEFQVSAKARNLIDQMIPPEEQTMGLEIIGGKANKVSEALQILRQCIEAVRTIGFLGGRKVVWLRNVTFFDQGIVGKSKAVQEPVKDLISTITTGMPDAHALVITAPSVDVKSALFKTCRRLGEVIPFEAPKPWKRDKPAAQYAGKAFRHYGLHATQEVIATFVEKVGTDSRQIEQEISKLSAFLDTRKDVRLDDLDRVVCAARDMFTWDLEDAVGEGDLERSITFVRQLLFQKNDPIRLIMCIEKRFRFLSVFREALDNQWLRLSTADKWGGGLSKEGMPANMDQLLSQALSSEKRKMHPFVMEKLARHAAGFSRRQLIDCRQLILQTRRKMVSSNVPSPLLLEMLVIKLCNMKQSGRSVYH